MRSMTASTRSYFFKEKKQVEVIVRVCILYKVKNILQEKLDWKWSQNQNVVKILLKVKKFLEIRKIFSQEEILLFLTEKAWSRGGLRSRELGQTPSHVSMGD